MRLPPEQSETELKLKLVQMGTFFSAFLSAISSKQSNEEANLNDKTSPTPPTTSSSLAKRKSKPELMIHSPFHGDDADVDCYQVHEFIWKYGAKESVHLAGSFTNWMPSISMVPLDHNREYWRALVKLDPKREWQFKFVVDGVWRCGLDLPTLTDPQGNTNNIIRPE